MNPLRPRFAALVVTTSLSLPFVVGCPAGGAPRAEAPSARGSAKAAPAPAPVAPAPVPPPSRAFRSAPAPWPLPAARAAEPYHWRPVRIGGGGYVTGLVVHPATPDVVYARTDVGGAYRWSEAEKRWTQLVTASRMPAAIVDAEDGALGGGMGRTLAYRVESLGVDPGDARVLYLALGDDLARPGFVVKSSDGGDSFRMTSLRVPMGGNQPLRMVGERFAVDPRDGRVVFYGSRNRGLFRSGDGGETWSPVAGLPAGFQLEKTDAGVAIVKFDASSPANERRQTTRLYASVAGAGIFRSDDAGATWSNIHLGFALDLELAEGVVYAATRSTGVLRYTPAGGFVDVSPAGERSIEDLAVDPRDHRRVFAVAEGFKKLYRTRDAGKRWEELGTSSQPAGRAHFRSPRIPWIESSTVRSWLSIGELLLDPHHRGRLWLAEGMGVWRSDNAGDGERAPDFDFVSEGIEETVATGAAAARGTLVVTLWDRIGFQLADPERYPARQLGLSSEFSTGHSVDATPAGVFAVVVSDVRFCCGDGNWSGRSLDAGATWARFGSIRGASNTPRELRFGELVVSPANPANMVWAPRNNEKRIFFTTDGGASWKEGALAGFANGTTYYLTTKKILAADPLVAGRFYAHSWEPGRVYVSSDGGARWTAAEGALPHGVWHGQLRAAPLRAGNLWFCTGPDYRGSPEQRGLFVSTDAGESFTRLARVEECWALGFGKGAPGGAAPTAFFYGKIGGEWGLFRSTDEGATFASCGDYPLGLFNEVASVAGDAARFGRVYVGFKGNGFVYGDPAARAVRP